MKRVTAPTVAAHVTASPGDFDRVVFVGPEEFADLRDVIVSAEFHGFGRKAVVDDRKCGLGNVFGECTLGGLQRARRLRGEPAGQLHRLVHQRVRARHPVGKAQTQRLGRGDAGTEVDVFLGSDKAHHVGPQQRPAVAGGQADRDVRIAR